MAKQTDKNLDKLLDQVADEVVAILAKADEEEVSLSKADPGQEAPGEETPAGSSAEGSDGAPEGSPGDAGGEEQSPGEASESPAAGGADGDGATEGSEQMNPAMDETNGPEALVAEYAKLPVEEIKMHLMAAHQAYVNATGGAAPDEAAPAPGPEASGMAPEASAPAGNPEPPIGKKEITTDGSGEIAKSELDVRLEVLEKALKDKDAEMDAMKAKFEEAAAGIEKFVTRVAGIGLRKSVSGVSEVAFIGKPGENQKQEVSLSRPEVLAKLNKLTASPELKKSDRELVNGYVIGGAPVDTIAHLLK